MNNPKQVIIVRRYFPDGKGGQRKVRTGKMIAQAAHASMKVFFDMMNEDDLSNGGDYEGLYSFEFFLDSMNTKSDKAVYEWIKGSFKKIVVYVDSESELLDVYNKAMASGILCSLIQDSGMTEFGGIPTYTSVAIGPDYPERIDPITSELKLL
jgi:PTH2 family peptidyl-tRNA hydrolase